MDKFAYLKERIKKNFKENKVLLFVFIAIWIATIAVTLFSYNKTLGKQSIGNEGAQEVVEITKTTTIKQQLLVEDFEDCENICLKFATYARKNNSGNLYIKVVGNNSKKEYLNQTVDVSKLIDNNFVTYDLNEKLESKNDTHITITITSDCEDGKTVGIYCSSNDVFLDNDLLIDNEKVEGDLSARLLKQNDELSAFYKTIIIFTIVTFTLIILLVLLVNPKLEVLFTIMALVFGLIFLVIITPMSVPDETAHYEYSFQLSNMIMGEKNHLVFDEEYQNYGSFAGHFNISAAYIRLVEKINKPLSLDNKTVVMLNDIKDSYITPFIPQALGITLARILELNMLKTFYLGRLFNLIFYVACVYIAIKNTPIHKTLFGVIATLPMLIQQAASYSYDCFINGLSLIVIAYVLRWIYQKEEISVKQLVPVFIVNLLIAPIKVVYGLFSFLFWFVPEERFGSKKKRIIYTLIVTAPAMYELCTLLLPLIIRIFRKFFEKVVYADIGESTYDYAPQYSEDDVYSFSDVINNPGEAIEIFVRTLRYNLKFWFYGAFGRTLSGSTLVVPMTIIYMIIGVVFAASLRSEPFVESNLFKVVSVLFCVFAGIMMVGGMLISWTPVNQDIIDAYGGPIIQGIQGRYFSPLLPYVFIVFNNKKINISEKFDKYIIGIYLVLIFEVIVYVLSYTFVN